MKKTKNKITITGWIASSVSKPYFGKITVDKKTGLIESVKKLSSAKTFTKLADIDYVFSKDCLIFPGMGDLHIHAREDQTGKQNYKEEYQTAGDAALSGGCVHICAMPNTPKPLTEKSDLVWHRNRINELNHPVSILNYIGIDKNTRPLGKPGEHFYKLYFGKSVGDLTVTYGSELDTILQRYVGHNISFHVEYEPIVQASAQGKTHSERRPVACVNEGLRLLLPLIEKYKIQAKLCHWSTGGESFEMIRQYQKRGCKITLEVSPLHLLFDTSMTDIDPSLWLKIQMNPAIQGPSHRMSLIKALKDGFISFLATDHAPHTVEEKYSAFSRYKEQFWGDTNEQVGRNIQLKDSEKFLEICKENGMSGAPWLDTYALVCVHLMSEYKFSPMDIARISSTNPGNFVNPFLERQFKKMKFGKGFGKIEKGYIGSLTILNIQKKTTVNKTDLKTKVGWSPLEGKEFKGSLEAVFVRGERLV